VGLGFRTRYFERLVRERPPLDVLEVVSENYMRVSGRARTLLETLRAIYPVILHGVGLDIASSDPLDERYLDALHDLAQRVEPEIVSDHLCWTTHRGVNTNDLMPVAYTEEVLLHVASRIDHVQERLGRSIAIENPSAYLAYAASEMGEAEFLARLAARTGCRLLLDVNNVFVCSKNLGVDADAYLARLLPDSVAYFHLAGHEVMEQVRIDTHDQDVPEEVWSLYAKAAGRFPDAPTIIERDGNYPELDTLLAEAERARSIPRTEIPSSDALPSSEPPRASAAAPKWPTLQARLFEQVVDRPQGFDHGPDLASAVAGLWSEGQPTPAAVGLRVYSDAYLLRLTGVLRDNFPALSEAIGSAFRPLCADYLAAHPPRGYSFVTLGADLADFLDGYDLDLAVAKSALVALVRLEQAALEVHDHEETASPIGVSVLQELQDGDWERLRVAMIAAHRFVASPYSVHEAYEAAREKRDVPVPRAEPHEYLLARPREQVVLTCLAPGERELFESLAAGTPFVAAIPPSLDPQAAVHSLVGWTAAGYLAGISLAAEGAS